jgi:lipid-A-disaccharide synthase
MGDRDVLFVVGEASGDLHGARLLQEMRRLEPRLRAFGLGGAQLRQAGLECVADSSEISVVGITEVVKILRRARRIFADLLDAVDHRQARAAILIDFPDFNLRMARRLKKRGLKVIYYISPQIWAWRRGRVKTISRYVDQMLVLLPFEVDFYRQHDVEAIHVGHPLVDEVPVLCHAWDEMSAPETPSIALLPGSRRSEVDVLLPIMLQTAHRLALRQNCRFVVIRAPNLPPERVEEQVKASALDLEIVSDKRFEAIASSHLAICAVGTATLEVGLLGTPMIATHRVSVWSYLLGRLLVDLPHASLVNLLLDAEVVPELIQSHANPDELSQRALQLLADPGKIEAMRRSLAELRERIGPPGASRRAAESMIRELRWS